MTYFYYNTVTLLYSVDFTLLRPIETQAAQSRKGQYTIETQAAQSRKGQYTILTLARLGCLCFNRPQ
jgi:hypothetical protein